MILRLAAMTSRTWRLPKTHLAKQKVGLVIPVLLLFCQTRVPDAPPNLGRMYTCFNSLLIVLYAAHYMLLQAAAQLIRTLCKVRAPSETYTAAFQIRLTIKS